MDIFNINVWFGNEVYDVGECDSEHISLITLIRATTDELNGQNEVPNDDCIVWVQLPWSGERVQVNSDIELLDHFRVFEDHGLDTIMFELENVYVPNPPGDEEPEVLAQDGGYQPLGWHDLEAEMLNYDGDSEKDDDKDDDEGEGSEGSEAGEGDDNYGQVPIVDEDAEDGSDRNDGNDRKEENDGNDDIIKECMSLFEGYQSKSDDEYFSDSELEPDKVKIAKLMKGNPFKKMVGGEIKFHVGQTFDNAVQMREIFREYAIQQGVVLHRVKNDNVRQTYKCLGDGCRWRAHGSRMIDRMTFMIKTLVDEHECHRVYNNKEAKVKWIASKFENLVKANPSIDIKVLGDLLRENYRVSVDVQRLYNAKKKALAGLAKDHAKCFGLLKRYAYMVNQTNPRSAVHICTQDPQPTFQRMFLSFEAQKFGFLEGCRPFIGVDGCHLKGPLEECYCLQWPWMQTIHLKYPSSRNLTFMSDRQKGVIQALELHFPFAKRRYCTRHIFANFRLLYKGEHYKKLFWRATRSCTEFDFNEAMNEIGAIDPVAKSLLQNIKTEHWSRAKSYLELLEFIRRMVMRKFQERKDECERWNSVLPPRVNAKIMKNSKESRLFTIIAAGNGEYELLGPTGGYGVKLREYSCQCGYWQISGIPCSHAMAAISHYCGKSNGALIPPPRTVQPGRPKTQRKREPDEPPKGGRSGTVSTETTQPSSSQNETTQPSSSQPATTQPSSSQPSTTQSQPHSQVIN
ncbi:hypothetical protein EZV62_000688 [Acer yangbiense]|uniref:SWIM-type domain-containing protein n=1 Tax=Acer yangbiense TaxID=1000413 RepID=A0A5C7ISM7_9ROSI|nr:hypothetical protein EZV62_000688 [Acer yangbiense]